VSRFVPRAKSNPFAFESVLTCFPLGSLWLGLPVRNTPHESFPTTSDFDLTPQSPESIGTIKTATHSAAPAHPRLRGRSRHWSSHGRSHDRCATTCHTHRLISRPPPWLAWVLGVPTLVPLILSAHFLLLMPLPLYRTIVPRPHLIPDWKLHIACPVPHSRRHPLSLHADSCHSSLTVRPFVPMSYEAQRHGVSLLYR